MAAKKSGLGRGLSALMEEMGSTGEMGERRGLSMLPLAAIEANPHQPRRSFREAELHELADSIRVKGVLQPILVRPAENGRYEIIAGERRWRASQMAGLHEIPVVVREFSEGDGFEAAIIENVQRIDLDPIEEASGYQRLIQEFGHTQEMVSALVGKARSHVANLLRLLDLPAEAQEMLRQGQLSVGHAKAVLQASDPMALASAIVERQMTVRQAEEAARKSHAEPRATIRRTAARDADVEMLEAQLEEALGLNVAIEARGGRGRVSIRFSDLDQLDLIVARLQG